MSHFDKTYWISTVPGDLPSQGGNYSKKKIQILLSSTTIL